LSLLQARFLPRRVIYLDLYTFLALAFSSKNAKFSLVNKINDVATSLVVALVQVDELVQKYEETTACHDPLSRCGQ